MKKLALLAALLILPLLALAQTEAAYWRTAWAVQHTPAATTQATIGKAAVAGTRHIATSITVCGNWVAAQATAVTFNLRDGATGAGTILWSGKLGGTAGTSSCLSVPGLWVGSLNTAMTLESAAAPASTNFAQVSLAGYDITP